MVAHTEPVKSRGDKPCGKLSFSTTTCVSAGGGAAPRPPGTGRGKPEVQTLRNSALKQAYGRRHISAGVAGRRASNEQRPSYAAASHSGTFAMAPSSEGSDRRWASSGFRETLSSRLNDDLGTAEQ